MIEIFDDDDEAYDGACLISGLVEHVRAALCVLDPVGHVADELWDDGHIHGGQDPVVCARIPDTLAVNAAQTLHDAGWTQNLQTTVIALHQVSDTDRQGLDRSSDETSP